MPYIDTETGTVVNGPVMHVDEIHAEDELSDSEISDYAEHHGTPVQPLSPAEARALEHIREWGDNEWSLAFGFVRGDEE